ncbi:hypothetical protein PLICRDRAFT_619643 [Plicaturopsis crispa FD-325 SS-3]|nr:hypothetical protein PLICRDRAFT_619643 [Plicaturopsis crispa FD-325 SS-3]
MAYQLTIATPLTPATIPAEEAILSAARELLDSTATWKQGKSYSKHVVRTYSRPKVQGDGAAWHCRVSEHSKEDATFDEIWAKLGADKARNEMEFIPDIKKVTEVKDISPSQSIWTLLYTFPPPISSRVFTVLQVVHLDNSSPRTGLVVSIPVDLTQPGDEELAKLEEKGVKGRYVSVERVRELDNGSVEWRMATSSSPGGSIPQFIAEKSMAGKISEDVPHFMHWLASTRSKATKADEAAKPVDPQIAQIPTATDTGNEAVAGAQAAGHVGGGGIASI